MRRLFTRHSVPVAMVLAGSLLATSVVLGAEGTSPRGCTVDSNQPNSPITVLLEPGWRSESPFAERFAARATAAEQPDDPVIDLEAFAFRTAPLVRVDAGGKRTFLSPDLSTFPPEMSRLAFTGGRTDLFIAQAVSPEGQARLLDFLQGGGHEILGYVPRYAYLVRLDPDGLAAVEERPEVSWVGLFQPAYRFSPVLDYVITRDPARELQFTVRLDPAEYATSDEVHGEVTLFGLTVTQVARDSGAWIARAAGRALDARLLGALPTVLWVERYVEPVLHNDVARTSSSVTTGRGGVAGPVMDVEDVWARGIRGEGQIASASDTGLDTGDVTTANPMHWDFGQTGSATNPMRILKGYALGRAGNWNDDQAAPMYGGHGTHTSGSIVGNGIRSGSTPDANSYGSSHAGVAPKAQFVFQSIMDSTGALGGLPADLNTLFQSPYNDGARVHSNSWGAAVAGAYTTDSSNTDKFAWNNKDMVITFSAGNSGVDSSTADGIIDKNSMGAPGTAKNTITVGAAESYRPTVAYEHPSGVCSNPTTWTWFNSTSYGSAPIASDHMANNANGMAAFSSRGPTTDGRIKPDIVAPGTFILSSRSSVHQAYEQWGVCGVPAGEQPYYVYMGGTSMSNPLTAGSATLVRQYYVDGWHANNSAVTNASAVPASGFNPSSALVKATLINGAWDMAPGQYGTGTKKEIPPSWDTGRTLPNNVEGFGRVDLERSLFPGSGWGDVPGRVLEVHDVTTGLATGGSNTTTFTVLGNGDPLIVTLVWTDPWASSGSGTKLVNNLDLVVTAPDGTTKFTPNKVDDTAGTADNLNNVEQVKVTSPASGTWTIQVKGTSVPGNGTAGTNSQPYALVVSGLACLVPAAPSTVPGARCGTGTVGLSASGAAAGQDYRWYAASNGGAPLQTGGASYTTPSISATTTYYVSIYDTTTMCESGRTTATATVNAVPGIPGGIGGSTCGAGTVALSASGAVAGQDYKWYAASSGGSALQTGGASYATPSISATTAYYVSTYDTTTLCESGRTVVTATVNAAVAATATGTPGARCGTGTVAVSASGAAAGQGYRWYSASSGGSALQTGGATYTTPSISATTTYYVSIYDTTTLCEGSRTAVTATINAVPGAPSGTPGSRCGTGTVALSASGAAAGQDYKWYAASSGGSSLQTGGAPYTTPSISATTTYYVSIYDTTTLCEGSRAAVTATVNAVPGAPSGTPSSRCGTGTVALSASGAAAGQDYKWYAGSSGGSALQTGGAAYTTPSISVTTTYHVSLYDTTTLCEGSRTVVTAMVNGIPSTPSISAPGSATSGATGLVAGVSPHAGATYAWGITNGTITAGDGTSQVTFTAGSVGTLTLTVVETNSAGCASPQASASVTVSAIGTLPDVNSFTSVPALVDPGGAAMLSWDTSGATNATLNGSPVSTSGSQVVAPISTTLYTLVATNSYGSTSRLAAINVNGGVGGLYSPAITAPTASQVIGVKAVTFTWGSVSGAAGYDLRVFDASSGLGVFSGSLTGPASTSTLIELYQGSFLFAVRTCNASGFGDSQCGPYATRSFSVVLFSPSGVPTLTAPAQGATLTVSTSALSWTAVTPNPAIGGLKYEVLLTDLQHGTTALQTSVPDPTLSTIFTMKSSTSYELKVRACQAGCGPWSTPVTFAVSLPSVPTGAPTITSADVASGNLTVNWTTVPGADLYQVQVVQPSGGPGGGALTVAARQVSATTVTFPVPTGAATIIVAACTGDGCGPQSGGWPINPGGSNPTLPNFGTPMAGPMVNGPLVLFTWSRIPGDTGSNTTYRLYAMDFARQDTALDVLTTNNYYGAMFKAEGTQYGAVVIANPDASGAGTSGPSVGFSVVGPSSWAPTLVAPRYKGTVRAGNITLGWTPVQGATLYNYYVTSGSNVVQGVTPGLFVQAPLTATGSSWIGIIRACPAGATCVAGSDAGWSPWSNTTGGTGVANFTVVP